MAIPIKPLLEFLSTAHDGIKAELGRGAYGSVYKVVINRHKLEVNSKNNLETHHIEFQKNTDKNGFMLVNFYRLIISYFSLKTIFFFVNCESRFPFPN